MPAKVYFTRELTPEKVVELYRALDVELPGKVAVKVHSGEMRPDWRPCGAPAWSATQATGGVRDNTESHLKLIEEHGWNKYFPVDLLDAQGPWCGPSPTGKS